MHGVAGEVVVLRPMRYEDIPQVAQIDREAFPEEWMFRSQSSYRRDLENPSVRYAVACALGDDASPGGASSTTRSPWFRRFLSNSSAIDGLDFVVGFVGFWLMLHEAHIISIGTRYDYRRRGIGEGLLIAATELAGMLEANVVTLEVRASNEAAQGLYRKYGFEVVGRRVKYYSSNGEDALIMSTDNTTTISFQACFQQLKRLHTESHREIISRIL